MKSNIARLLVSAAAGIVMMAACPLTASAALDSGTAQFMKNMGAGWNLGNSLDANTGDYNTVHSANSETSWGNPVVTEALVKKVHQSGFESIRIPVSWANHMSSDYKIDKAWLDRVQQVVDYAYKDGMYVILNTHHDNLNSWESGIGYYPDSAHTDISRKYVQNVWTQIADRFKDYGDRLIFETLNEPRLRGNGAYEWYFDPDAPDATARDSMAVINELNQLAVTTIRSRGGKNSTRYIMVPAYVASHFNALGNYFTLPQDTVKSNKNRIVVSVHAYRPYDLCLAGWVTTFDQTGKNELNKLFSDLNSKFLSKGVPVIIGEMGISDKNNAAVRREWFGYYYGLSKQYNIPCFMWDNNAGQNGEDGERHGHLDRGSLTWRDPQIISTIMSKIGPSEKPLYGDVEGNKSVSSSDVALLQQYLAGWNVSINMKNSDVTTDNAVDNQDLSLLQQYLAGWNVTLGA